jgi:hypothetical protein
MHSLVLNCCDLESEHVVSVLGELEVLTKFWNKVLPLTTDQSNWPKAKSLIQTLPSYLGPFGRYGVYSNNSVCLYGISTLPIPSFPVNQPNTQRASNTVTDVCTTNVFTSEGFIHSPTRLGSILISCLAHPKRKCRFHFFVSLRWYDHCKYIFC